MSSERDEESICHTYIPVDGSIDINLSRSSYKYHKNATLSYLFDTKEESRHN